MTGIVMTGIVRSALVLGCTFKPIYAYDGKVKSIADYLAGHPTTGLLIARDDTILFEHYRYGRSDRDRFTSWSMAKTVLGLLVGIAGGPANLELGALTAAAIAQFALK